MTRQWSLTVEPHYNGFEDLEFTTLSVHLAPNADNAASNAAQFCLSHNASLLDLAKAFTHLAYELWLHENKGKVEA